MTPIRKAPLDSQENDIETDDERELRHRRKRIYFDYGVNLPSLVALVVAIGSLIGWLIQQNDRIVANTKEIQLVKQIQELSDKGIIDHSSAVEQTAVRDRAEMRTDIAEIKGDMKTLLKRGK